MAYTTTELLADVRRSGMFPNATQTGTADADLLAHGDKEIQSRLLPLILEVKEEFYVRSKDYALTANVSSYRIPPRAIGSRLRDVLAVASDGSSRNLVRLEPERITEFFVVGTGTPWAFYLEGNSVVLLPPPASTADTLRLKFFARPNRLILTTAARQILTITPGAGAGGSTRIALASAVPGGWDATKLYDIVRASPGFEHAAFDATAATVSGANIDVTAAQLPSDFTTANYANDWVCLAEESPIAQLPAELHQAFAQRLLCRVLDATGDLERLAPAMKAAEELEKGALMLLQPRIDGEPRKLVGKVLSRRRRPYGWWR